MQVRVVGAHLPRLDPDGIAQYIGEYVERFKKTLYSLNETSSIHTDPAEIEARALELPKELDYDLQRCALFELEVTGNESVFEPSEHVGWGANPNIG